MEPGIEPGVGLGMKPDMELGMGLDMELGIGLDGKLMRYGLLSLLACYGA